MEHKNSKRAIFSTIMNFNGNSKKIFSLLCPTREYDWINGWKCDLLYSDSGYAEELCIFKTDLPSFGPETWICSRYEPNSLIHYIRFSEDKLIRMNLSLMSNEENSSSWNLEYILTAINNNGEYFIKTTSQSMIDDIGEGFMKKINYYLKYNKMLK
jgi:hypothetical protein